jgi:hypothetical protein
MTNQSHNWYKLQKDVQGWDIGCVASQKLAREYLELTSVNSDVENGNIKLVLSVKS